MVRPRQADIYRVRTTVLTLLTSNQKSEQITGNARSPTGTEDLPGASVVVASQIATVDKNRLPEKIGTLSKETLEELIKGCQMAISLSLY
jgi:mRNA interferase MazF